LLGPALIQLIASAMGGASMPLMVLLARRVILVLSAAVGLKREPDWKLPKALTYYSVWVE
jgi:hypothetical protein